MGKFTKVFALDEGSYSVAAEKKFIPFDVERDNPKDRPASIFVHVKPFLIEHGSQLILLDTGLGYQFPDGDLFIHKAIQNKGYNPKDVTHVLISHLHFDHAGGLMYEENGRFVPSFPDADYYIYQKEWEYANAKQSLSYKAEMFSDLRSFSGLHLIQDGEQITPEIRFEETGAHSQHHGVFYFDFEDQAYFFGGDVLPEPQQLVRNYIAKYDLDGRKAMELRKAYGEMAIAENRICLFYHANKGAIGKVKKLEGAFVVEEVREF
jgi:glyoxylase-like metal-dependent hydrolase (beta-lactamase superfamily II)